MEHSRSKLPAMLAVLFCIALLAGVGVLLWKTLPEKQKPEQAETIQTDGVFSNEPTTVEPEREAPYEGELPGQAAQPETPDEQPQPGTDDQNETDPQTPDAPEASAAQQTAQALLDTMTDEEKIWQLFFVTPEAITNVNTATVAGETTKKALEQYPVGGIVYFAKNLEDREQTVALLENTQSYAKIPLFLGVDEEGGTVSRVGSNPDMGVPSVGDMRSLGKQQDPAAAYAAGQDIGGSLHALGFNLDFAPVADVAQGADSVIGSRSFGSDPEPVRVAGRCDRQEPARRGHCSHASSTSRLRRATVDDHNGTSIVEKTLSELEGCDLVPFQSITPRRGASRSSWSRTCSYPNVTGSDTPADLSASIVTDILRDKPGLSERHHHRLALHGLHHRPLFRRRCRRQGPCRRMRHDPHAVRSAGCVLRRQGRRRRRHAFAGPY